MPPLPVFPCGIVHGVVALGPLARVMGRPAALPRGVLVGRLMMACPAVTPEVVSGAFGGVREEGVGSDKQTITLEAHVSRQLKHGGRGVALVWVVQFYERVEALFGVG